jgi:hypothetical protein
LSWSGDRIAIKNIESNREDIGGSAIVMVAEFEPLKPF